MRTRSYSHAGFLRALAALARTLTPALGVPRAPYSYAALRRTRLSQVTRARPQTRAATSEAAPHNANNHSNNKSNNIISNHI